jgi:uracil DNA glycosylase
MPTYYKIKILIKNLHNYRHTSDGFALLSAVHNSCLRAAKAFFTSSAFTKEQ